MIKLTVCIVFFFGFSAFANVTDALKAFKTFYPQDQVVSEPTAFQLSSVCDPKGCKEKYFITQTSVPKGEGTGARHAAMVQISQAGIEIKTLVDDFTLEILKSSLNRSVPVKKINISSKAGGSLLIELNRPVEAFKLAYDQTESIGEPIALIESSDCGFSCSNSFIVIQQFKTVRKAALLTSNGVESFFIRTLKPEFLDNLEQLIDTTIPSIVLPQAITYSN